MHIGRGHRIIDVGCGSGATGQYLADLGVRACGIDISFEATRSASQIGRYALVLQGDAESLPFADQVFDGAVFMGTLEHFFDPVKALREVIRALKPGASICFLVPNSQFFLFKFMRGTGQPHEVPRTYEGWRQLFETEGLRIETVYRDTGPGLFEGGVLRGVLRMVVLAFFNLLPIRYTYQFVFIGRSRDLQRDHKQSLE